VKRGPGLALHGQPVRGRGGQGRADSVQVWLATPRP
jgi:hypothetical protein